MYQEADYWPEYEPAEMWPSLAVVGSELWLTSTLLMASLLSAQKEM